MKTDGHIQRQDLEAIKNWSHKPLRCDCGCDLKDKHFTVLRSGHSPQQIVFLAVLCDCSWYWLVDTEGTAFAINEK